MTANRDYALRYIERYGWSPVPLWTVAECAASRCNTDGTPCPPKNHGKHPRILWHEHQLPGPVTVEQVNRWWGQHPMSGVAILTGKRSGIDVIDIDPGNGGSLEALVAKWPEIPSTPTVRTGSGGDHIYVEWPGVRTSNGIAKAIGLPGIDYRGDGGLVVAVPTVHYSGNVYEFHAAPPEPIPTPPFLLEIAKQRHDQRAEREKTTAELARRLAANPPSAPPAEGATSTGANMTNVALRKIRDSVAAAGKPGGRHDTVRDQAFWLAGLIDSGHLTEDYIRNALVAEAVAVTSGEGREAEMAEAIEWGIEHGRTQPWQPEERHRITVLPRQVDAPAITAPVSDAATALRRVVDAARVYQHLPDPTHLIAALAVAATVNDNDEPVWLMLVAAPSSGKTETTRALEDLADARLDDVTAPGLLSWKTGKDARPTGVFAKIGSGSSLVTFGDLSSLLATSDRGGRDTVFSMLRSAYDGYVVRSLGSAPAPLEWRGRLTVVAAVTGVIDQYASHNDALGPRWLSVRMPEAGTAARRKAAKLSRRGGLNEARRSLRDAATATVMRARANLPAELDDVIEDAIEDAALVTCWGRAAVPRHGYGQREIDGAPTIEEPPRLIRQLRGLARGLVALGLDTDGVCAVIRRVAVDSMPSTRRAVLAVLSDGELLTTSAVGRSARLHRHVARRQLEELEAIGVVEATREGEEPGEGDQDRRTAEWRLSGEDGVLVAQVFQTLRATGGTWHEKLVPLTTLPKEEEEDGSGSNTSCHPPNERTAA